MVKKCKKTSPELSNLQIKFKIKKGRKDKQLAGSLASKKHGRFVKEVKKRCIGRLTNCFVHLFIEASFLHPDAHNKNDRNQSCEKHAME